LKAVFPLQAGLDIITFLWKVIKIKNYPKNPVDPVQKKLN
jgi:hypothetical protein